MLPPLYHLLHPIWPRLPLPVRPRWAVEQVGPLTAIRCWREVLGNQRLSVYAYAVEGVLVDTGISSLGEPVLRFAREQKIERAVITHHHEDHSGNAARLHAEGLTVHAPPLAKPLIAAGFPIKLYEHLFWGPAAPTPTADLPDRLPFGPYTAQILPAPGHCPDQVCFYVAERGWLFSGDAFIHERVRVFRQDEDFDLTLATLDRLCALDFDALFCAHRPRPAQGRAALIQKREWLYEIQGRVRRAHAEGAPPREIVRRLQRDTAIGSDREMRLFTLGDASTLNMVLAVLNGPRERPSVRRLLAGT